MNNAELVADFTRTVEVEGEVHLQVAVVEWPEPGSPTMVWKTFRRWKRQPKPERLVAAQQKAATVPVFALCASGSRVTASSVIANFLPARESYRPAAVLPEGEFRERAGRAIRLVVVGRERGARQFVEPLAIPRAAHDIRHEEPAAREFVQARAHDAAPAHGL